MGNARSRDGWPCGGKTVGTWLPSDPRNEKGDRSEMRSTVLGTGCTSPVSWNKSMLSRCLHAEHTKTQIPKHLLVVSIF